MRITGHMHSAEYGSADQIRSQRRPIVQSPEDQPSMEQFFRNRNQYNGADSNEPEMLLRHGCDGLIVLVEESWIDCCKQHSQQQVANPVKSKKDNADNTDPQETAPTCIEKLLQIAMEDQNRSAKIQAEKEKIQQR